MLCWLHHGHSINVRCSLALDNGKVFPRNISIEQCWLKSQPGWSEMLLCPLLERLLVLPGSPLRDSLLRADTAWHPLQGTGWHLCHPRGPHGTQHSLQCTAAPPAMGAGVFSVKLYSPGATGQHLVQALAGLLTSTCLLCPLVLSWVRHLTSYLAPSNLAPFLAAFPPCSFWMDFSWYPPSSSEEWRATSAAGDSGSSLGS